MVCDVPPLMLQVKVYGATPFAPVKVIVGCVPFKHTVAAPPMVAAGIGLTVTVTTKLFVQAFGAIPAEAITL